MLCPHRRKMRRYSSSRIVFAPFSILSLESECLNINRPSNDTKSVQTDDLSPRKLDNSEKWSIFASITDCLSSYIFFCTTNIHIFSDNLLFSSDFFKFFKDHMPASCGWELRMFYIYYTRIERVWETLVNYFICSKNALGT